MNFSSPFFLIRLLLSSMIATQLEAQIVSYDGFGEYDADVQVESDSIGLNKGLGWGGAFDVNGSITQLVKIENRSSSPVNYENGDVIISGGNRALRFYDIANGSFALRRPLGVVFDAARNETLWFSFLFRTATGGASPLTNQDFFQVGFDNNPNGNGSSGNPRVSIGANTISASFPSGYHFFARSTTAAAASAYHSSLPIAAATTYLLVGRIQPNAGVYNSVSLFVDPSSIDDPGPPSASITLPSGLTTLSHAFIRTVNLDVNDAYVMDEWHIGRDYGSVVQSLNNALKILPAATPGGPLTLRWPASLIGVVLETSTSLETGSWEQITDPISRIGVNYEFPAPIEPANPRRFFRLKRF
jgi:hypothetical protein